MPSAENKKSDLRLWCINFFPVALGILIFIVFYPAIHNGFTNWDDVSHLLRNPHVPSLNCQSVVEMFKSLVNKTYIPLTTLSYAIEYQFWGFNPIVYHSTNTVLHFLVCLTAWNLGIKLGLSRSAVCIGIVIFAIHPMHVESVAWVTGRKDLLYSLFYLLSLNSYLKYIENKRPWDFVMSLIFSMLSVMGKPMAISLPIMLVLIDWLKGRKLEWRLLSEKIPFIIIIVPVVWITYAANMRVPGSGGIGKAILLWIWSLGFYIQKFIAPVVLVPLYQAPRPVQWLNPVYIITIIFVFTFLYLIIRSKDRWLKFAFLFYFLSVFYLLRYDEFDGSIVADRFMYLASLGICFWVGNVSEDFIKKCHIKPFVIGILIVILALMTFKTRQQIHVWRDSVTLWTNVIDNFPGMDSGYVNRSDAYAQLGQWDKGLKDVDQAIMIPPERSQEYYDRAVFYMHLNKNDEAQQDLKRALELFPSDTMAINNLGIVLTRLGKLEDAKQMFIRGLSLDPHNKNLKTNLELLLKTL